MQNSLTIIFVTMGEPTTFGSLDAIRDNTPEPYDLIIWNNGCKEDDFTSRLNEYSDNVINCTKNQGLLEAMNYAFLTSKNDYILFLCAGVSVTEGYLDILLKPFKDIKVGITSEYQFPTTEYVESTVDDIPEGAEIYSRRMLDDIGLMCPSFKTWGTAPTELKYRAITNGWKVIGTPKCATHINVEGEGKDKLGSVAIHRILLENNFVFKSIKRRGYVYKWWDSDILKSATEDDLILSANQVLV